jgi:hypothetical protein
MSVLIKRGFEFSPNESAPTQCWPFPVPDSTSPAAKRFRREVKLGRDNRDSHAVLRVRNRQLNSRLDLRLESNFSSNSSSSNSSNNKRRRNKKNNLGLSAIPLRRERRLQCARTRRSLDSARKPL